MTSTNLLRSVCKIFPGSAKIDLLTPPAAPAAPAFTAGASLSPKAFAPAPVTRALAATPRKSAANTRPSQPPNARKAAPTATSKPFMTAP